MAPRSEPKTDRCAHRVSRIEGVRVGVRARWLGLVAVLTVGVSLGSPLLLYLRELALERKPDAA